MSRIEIDIVTPEKKVFTDKVDMVSTRTTIGEIGILPQHAPLVGPLEITTVRIKKDGKEQRIAVSGGFLEVRPDKVTVLAETAELPEEIDRERAQKAKERAERRLNESDGDVKRAERALKRAVNRLDVAEWR